MLLTDVNAALIDAECLTCSILCALLCRTDGGKKSSTEILAPVNISAKESGVNKSLFDGISPPKSCQGA
jgi:hypothetical protein